MNLLTTEILVDKSAKIEVPVKMLLNPVHFFALGFGSGLTPKIPGTAGTLAGVLLFILMPDMSWMTYLLIIVCGFLFGIFCCGYTAKILNAHDHHSIVCDEIIGFLVTMFMVPKEWIWILIGFILFRTFDILKPWPISFIDRRIGGGLGIMLDDVIAALFSLAIIQIVIYFL